MPSVQIAITSGADDIFTQDSVIYPSYSYLFVFVNTEHGQYANTGLRFPSVDVPQGATIDSATITTYGGDSIAGAPLLYLYGDDVDDAGSWTASGAVNEYGRFGQSRQVSWKNGTGT